MLCLCCLLYHRRIRPLTYPLSATLFKHKNTRERRYMIYCYHSMELMSHCLLIVISYVTHCFFDCPQRFIFQQCRFV